MKRSAELLEEKFRNEVREELMLGKKVYHFRRGTKIAEKGEGVNCESIAENADNRCEDNFDAQERAEAVDKIGDCGKGEESAIQERADDEAPADQERVDGEAPVDADQIGVGCSDCEENQSQKHTANPVPEEVVIVMDENSDGDKSSSDNGMDLGCMTDTEEDGGKDVEEMEKMSDEQKEAESSESKNSEFDNPELRVNVDLAHLKALHPGECDSAFFEFVVAEWLQIPFTRAMKVPEFAQYVAAMMQIRPQRNIASWPELPFTLLGRKVRGIVTESINIPRTGKEIVKYDILDNNVPFSVLRIINRKNNIEAEFYSSVQSAVLSGDFTGVPLLLNTTSVDGSTAFFIPDYGNTLAQHISDFKLTKTPFLYLSVVSTTSSLPATHADGHQANICVYRPDIAFCYVWMIRLSTCIIEISWKNMGAITFIDWEKFLFSGKTCPSSSGSLLYKRQPWKYVSRSIPALGIEQASYSGENGMWILLGKVFSRIKENVKDKTVQVAFCPLNPMLDKTPVLNSVLQVFPSQSSESVIPSVVKSKWSQKFSTHGLKLKNRQKLSKLDNRCIAELVSEFQQYCTNSDVFRIPSDTGLVSLKNDGTLIATKNIPANAVVTHVTTSKIEPLDQRTNPVVSINMFTRTILKVLLPCGGFGSFAKMKPAHLSNCYLSLSSNKSFVLVASVAIPAGTEIVCSNEKTTMIPSYSPRGNDEFLTFLNQKISELAVAETRDENAGN